MTTDPRHRSSEEDGGEVGRIDAEKASGEVTGPRHRLIFGVGVMDAEAANDEEEDDGIAEEGTGN